MNICPQCKRAFKGNGLGAHVPACPGAFEALFWSKIAKAGADECWLWNGKRDASGYGRVQPQGPNTYAHRVAWRLANGPVPAGMDVLHRCDVRNCCNPAHYFLGTQIDNNKDAIAKRRTTWGERSAHAKLKREQAEAIIAEYRRYGPRRSNAAELAAKYGVGTATITSVVAGRSWPYLERTKPGGASGSVGTAGDEGGAG